MNFYTCAEVAERLKVKVDTVYKWIRDNRLEANEISYNTYRISEDQLMRFLAETRKESR